MLLFNVETAKDHPDRYTNRSNKLKTVRNTKITGHFS